MCQNVGSAVPSGAADSNQRGLQRVSLNLVSGMALSVLEGSSNPRRTDGAAWFGGPTDASQRP